jgi:hypothetical protein
VRERRDRSSGGGPVTHSFDVRFERAGRGWRARVVQTAGRSALPRDTVVFRGRSLASMKEKMDGYLMSLELEDLSVSYDFRSALTREQAEIFDAALGAIQEAESAEYMRVRLCYAAVQAFRSTRFSMRDISVLLRESRTTLQHIVRDGRAFQQAERRDVVASDAAYASDEIDSLGNGPRWYSQHHVNAGLSPGAAVALDIAFGCMPFLSTDSDDEVAMMDRLPDRFSRRYDREFVERFVGVFEDVFDAITVLDSSRISRSPASEIAMAILIEGACDQVRGVLLMGPNVTCSGDLESLRSFRESMTEDFDVDFLWGHEYDGLEEDATRMGELGIGKALRFENWFKPYRPAED